MAEVVHCKKSLAACCKIHLLLIAKVTRCKKSLVTRCKIRSSLVAEGSLQKITRYSLQNSLVTRCKKSFVPRTITTEKFATGQLTPGQLVPKKLLPGQSHGLLSPAQLPLDSFSWTITPKTIAPPP